VGYQYKIEDHSASSVMKYDTRFEMLESNIPKAVKQKQLSQVDGSH